MRDRSLHVAQRLVSAVSTLVSRLLPSHVRRDRNVGRPILAAAGFQPASRLKGGCRHNWPPGTFKSILTTFLFLLTAVTLPAATRYPVTGIILTVDRPHRSFDASCAAIPGYMEAMAMPYSVLDDHELADLKPGAYVDFTLVVEKERAYAEGIHIHRYESSEREP